MKMILFKRINFINKIYLNCFKFIQLINLIVCVFYPRYKLDGLNDYLSVYYGCLDLIDDNEINIDLIINNDNSKLNSTIELA